MKPRPPLAPRKHLGQNFLVDPKAKDRIIAACELDKEEEDSDDINEELVNINNKSSDEITETSRRIDGIFNNKHIFNVVKHELKPHMYKHRKG